MATQGERIVALETKMTHLVEMIAEHREESRQAAYQAKLDRDKMQIELQALTTLATDGKARLSVLWWLAGLSGSVGAAVMYLMKSVLPFWPRP
jgi:hypothetical protein